MYYHVFVFGLCTSKCAASTVYVLRKHRPDQDLYLRTFDSMFVQDKIELDCIVLGYVPVRGSLGTFFSNRGFFKSYNNKHILITLKISDSYYKQV